MCHVRFARENVRRVADITVLLLYLYIYIYMYVLREKELCVLTAVEEGGDESRFAN